MIICDKFQWRSMLLHVTGCLMVTSMGVAVFANYSTKFADYCPFIVVCSAVTLLPLILGFLGYIFARNEYLLLGVWGPRCRNVHLRGVSCVLVSWLVRLPGYN